MTVAFAVVAIVSFPFFFIPSVVLSVVALIAGLLTFLTEAIEAGMRGLHEAQRIDALREDRSYELDAQSSAIAGGQKPTSRP